MPLPILAAAGVAAGLGGALLNRGAARRASRRYDNLAEDVNESFDPAFSALQQYLARNSGRNTILEAQRLQQAAGLAPSRTDAQRYAAGGSRANVGALAEYIDRDAQLRAGQSLIGLEQQQSLDRDRTQMGLNQQLAALTAQRAGMTSALRAQGIGMRQQGDSALGQFISGLGGMATSAGITGGSAPSAGLTPVASTMPANAAAIAGTRVGSDMPSNPALGLANMPSFGPQQNLSEVRMIFDPYTGTYRQNR